MALTSPWSATMVLRIMVADNNKRTLQQRWTRILGMEDGSSKIEERWQDVPVVVVKEGDSK